MQRQHPRTEVTSSASNSPITTFASILQPAYLRPGMHVHVYTITLQELFALMTGDDFFQL